MSESNVEIEIIFSTIESITENAIKRNSEMLEKINSEENSNNEISISA